MTKLKAHWRLTDVRAWQFSVYVIHREGDLLLKLDLQNANEQSAND